jgi:para-aminobenzoate synthetase component 1
MSATAPAVTPLVEELVPCPDPWDVARKFAHLPHLLYLDSAERHAERGRYSYVMAAPYGTAATNWTGCEQMARQPVRVRRVPGLPPFQGGYAGLIGYETGLQFEQLPGPRTDEFLAPPLALFHYDWVVAFDHHLDRAWVVSTGDIGCEWRGQTRRAETGMRAALRVLRQTEYEALTLPERTDPLHHSNIISQVSLPGFPDVTSNFSPDSYIAAVRRAIEYIHAGDCFQVNLSQRLLAPLREHPLELYGRLRKTNPAPFACYFDAGDFQVVSASPERFLQVSPGGEVVTKPIKGTRPRGKSPEEDADLVRDLTNSPKDRAENVMIVDLLRNDLGRVCEYGSVRVPKVCEVETYPFVHHLVSEVRGKLRQGMTPFDLLRAAFPGGSVTGAPKVRAMEIIAELEPTARGPYCGSVGFIGFDGAMDTNILIRTFTAGRGWLQFPVGGGIVADSDPEQEYEETLHKAAGLLRALEP